MCKHRPQILRIMAVHKFLSSVTSGRQIVVINKWIFQYNSYWLCNTCITWHFYSITWRTLVKFINRKCSNEAGFLRSSLLEFVYRLMVDGDEGFSRVFFLFSWVFCLCVCMFFVWLKDLSFLFRWILGSWNKSKWSKHLI